MKHGVAFRKFSRTSSHRMLMLRNLVTSLFEHEQIKTTLPKARDAARLAEKIITMGKKGDTAAYQSAASFLLKPVALTNLFETFSKRYSERPGGYTRIHKFGNRPGDNAPHAILELVDNPRDLRWEMTSRAVGREILKDKLMKERTQDVLDNGLERVNTVIRLEKGLSDDRRGILRQKTRLNLQKVLRYRDSSAVQELSSNAAEYADNLLATPMAYQALHEELQAKNPQTFPPRRQAGQQFVGETRPALSIARGILAPDLKSTPPSRKKGPVFSLENALTRSLKTT